MAIKKRVSKDSGNKTENVERQVTFDQAESLADELADKTYGEVKDSSLRKNEDERLTITLSGDIYDKVENIARNRKKLKKPNKTMSAVVREALDEYITKYNL